ncbi:hypothetical protein SEA_ROONEY_86 [Streptomyces phage Rooney]|jgi:hypothetical protein|nr:hypothetical protein SEA_GIBSON_86 [Streptomyces phage Gibson]QYW07343.1 hypothetical protein SEA_ROONEY_86 [Streptomyces phage Rooney]
MRDVLHRLAGRLPRRAAERVQAEPPRQASPSLSQREQIAALIKRDYPFMSDDCIQQVLNDM